VNDKNQERKLFLMDENSPEIFAYNVTWRLKARLAKTGESYAQFARRLDLPYGWLIRIATKGVRQTSKRTFHHLEKLAEEFGIEVNWLWRVGNPLLPQPKVLMEEFRKRHLIHFVILQAYYFAYDDGTPKEDIKKAEDDFRFHFEDIYHRPVVVNFDDVCKELVGLVEQRIRVVYLQDDEVEN